MSFINVAEWTPKHVVQWLQGLEDCIQPYVNFFLNSDNQVNGCRLLLLSHDDLAKLHIDKVGHQEIILDSIELLKHLHYSFTSETLQTLALKLGCKSRSLYNHLKKEANCNKCASCLERLSSPTQPNYDENAENELLYSNLFPQYKKSSVARKPMPAKKLCRQITTTTLCGVCDILVSVKQFTSWIDRYSFDDAYTLIRQTILRTSIELASTAQRDHFVENPKEIIKNNCLKFAEMCDRIVQESKDSLSIQPVCLELVPIKRKEDEELGIQIHSSYNGVHTIGAVKIQSPAHRCGRIEEGDEIVQINYQTVLGWTQAKLIETMREELSTKILITIKKRPSHSRVGGQLKVLEPTKIPNRQVCTKSVNSQLFQEFTNFQQQDGRPTVLSSYLGGSVANRERGGSYLRLNGASQTNGSDYQHACADERHIYGNLNGNLNGCRASASQSTICIQNHENKECCEQNITNHNKLIEQISQEKPMKGPVYPMANKPKKLRRRATISGSTVGNQTSPTNLNPPIRIEDLAENFYLNKQNAARTSNLNLDDDPFPADDQANGGLYKSFNHLTTTDQYVLDDQLDLIIQRKPTHQHSLSKRTCSEDDSQFKKRAASACYDEACYADAKSREFFKQNYLSLPKQPAAVAGDNRRNEARNADNGEEFNRVAASCRNEAAGCKRSEASHLSAADTTDHCFIRSGRNNATVIKVNVGCSKSVPFAAVSRSDSSSSEEDELSADHHFQSFDQPVNERFDRYDLSANRFVTSDVEVTNKHIVHVPAGHPATETSSNKRVETGLEASSPDKGLDSGPETGLDTMNRVSSFRSNSPLASHPLLLNRNQSKQAANQPALGVSLAGGNLQRGARKATTNELESDDLKIAKCREANAATKFSLSRQDVQGCSPGERKLESCSGDVRSRDSAMSPMPGAWQDARPANETASKATSEAADRDGKDYETTRQPTSDPLKPEVLKRKRSLNKQAKLIKNLNCYQLRNNCDHKGWLRYLREELEAGAASSQKSSPNLPFSTDKQQSAEQAKWRENYLILKHELLYFYANDDDEQQPCRIINLPTFELDDDLAYRAGLHVFRIKSPRYAFSFASDDLQSLSNWINRFKSILHGRRTEDRNNSPTITHQTNNHHKSNKTTQPSKRCANKSAESAQSAQSPSDKRTVNTSFKPNSNQYHSFNSNHHHYQQQLNGQQSIGGLILRPKHSRLAHSVRDLNADENSMNDKLNYFNSLTSKSSAQIALPNARSEVKCEKFGNQMDARPSEHLNALQNWQSRQQPQVYRLGAKYFNNGVRSQSCVDSNFLSQYSKSRPMSPPASNQPSNPSIHCIQSNQSINHQPSAKDPLPPASPIKPTVAPVKPASSQSSSQSINDFYLSSQQWPIGYSTSYNVVAGAFKEPLFDQADQLAKQNQINQQNEQNQLNQLQEQQQLKKEIPKPQPRISKMKEQNANFVGKIISEFDELQRVCQKELEHYSSLRRRNGNGPTKTVNEMNKINSTFNSYPRNLTSTGKKESGQPATKGEPEGTQQLSLLDREYNRLFKRSPPNQGAIKTATSKEIQSIYLKQHDPTPLTASVNLLNGPISPISNPVSSTISADKLRERCNSPISDHSLSSSSGISSYYSMGQDVQNGKYLSNLSADLDAYSSNASTNFSFSPNRNHSTTSSSLDRSADHLDKQNDPAKRTASTDSKADRKQLELQQKADEKAAKKEDKKSVQRKSSFNSFRLFGSSKVLSKLSSSSKSSPEDEKSKTKNGFLTSPRLKRSFFGLRKNSLPNTATVNSTAVQTEPASQATPVGGRLDAGQLSSSQNGGHLTGFGGHHVSAFLNPHHLNRGKSKSSELLNSYYMDQFSREQLIREHLNRDQLNSRAPLNQLDQLNKPMSLSNKLPDDNYEPAIPQTPESHRKPPTMGLTMLSKRRSSSVSCNQFEIESAFQMLKTSREQQQCGAATMKK